MADLVFLILWEKSCVRGKTMCGLGVVFLDLDLVLELIVNDGAVALGVGVSQGDELTSRMSVGCCTSFDGEC